MYLWVNKVFVQRWHTRYKFLFKLIPNISHAWSAIRLFSDFITFLELIICILKYQKYQYIIMWNGHTVRACVHVHQWLCMCVYVCVLNEVHKQIYGQQHSIIKCFNKRTRLQQQQLAWACTKSGCHAMRRRSTKRGQRLKYVYACMCVCVFVSSTHKKILVYYLGGGGACSCVAHVLAARWSQRWRRRERHSERVRKSERDGQSVSKGERAQVN